MNLFEYLEVKQLKFDWTLLKYMIFSWQCRQQRSAEQQRTYFKSLRCLLKVTLWRGGSDFNDKELVTWLYVISTQFKRLHFFIGWNWNSLRGSLNSQRGSDLNFLSFNWMKIFIRATELNRIEFYWFCARFNL